MKVLNYGSLNYDYVYGVEHFVTPGETLTSQSFQKFYGGKGLNQTISLKRAGTEVYHAGMIGSDGESFLSLCKENEIPTEYIRTVDDVSGHAIIQVNNEGENCILLCEGANGRNSIDQIQQVLGNFSKGDILLVQNEINCLEELIQHAYEKGMKIILNPSPFNSKLTKSMFDQVDIFIMNEVEGSQVTGKELPDDILESMKLQYPHAAVLVTLGSKGSIYQDKEQKVTCDSFKVNVVDTTAAGDTYTGYFIAGLQTGLSIEKAMRQAAAASAIAVMRKGASPSIPKMDEVESFLRKY